MGTEAEIVSSDVVILTEAPVYQTGGGRKMIRLSNKI
jgi:hypothetical protein